VLQDIISENMRWIKNMFRQKFCEFDSDDKLKSFDDQLEIIW